jgi:RNA polymerase sigma-70 factor (ECF subfamily)
MGEPDAEDGERASEGMREYLLLLARMQLGSRPRRGLEASDVVQQTLMDAHRTRDQFRGQGAGARAAWLRRLLACNIVDARRALGRAKRDMARERSLEAELEASSARVGAWLAADQTSPSQAAERHERAIKLADALARLPEAQRQALVLRHFGGLSLAELSEQLGRSPDAVAGLLKRGARTLRSLLNDRA